MNDNNDKNLNMENLEGPELEQVSAGLKQEKRFRHVWEVYCTKSNTPHSIWNQKPEAGDFPIYCPRCRGTMHFKVREYDKEIR